MMPVWEWHSAARASGHIVTTKRVQRQQDYSLWQGCLKLINTLTKIY
jgi:hypothetical protein